MSLPVFGSCQSYWYNYYNCMKWINYHYIAYWKSRALAAENENRMLYSTLYNGLYGENGPFIPISSYNMNYTGQIGSEYLPKNSHLIYPSEVESSDHMSFNASLRCSTSTDEENDDSENDDSENGDSENDDSENDDSENDDSENDDSENNDSENDDSENDDGENDSENDDSENYDRENYDRENDDSENDDSENDDRENDARENDDRENDEVYDGDSYNNDSYGTLHPSAEDSLEFQVDSAMMEFLKLNIQYKNSKEDEELEPGVSHYGIFRAAEKDEFIGECKFKHTGDNDETKTEQEHKENTGNLENLCTFKPENCDNTMDEEKCIEMETCNIEEEKNPIKKISKSKRRRNAKRRREMLLRKKEEKKKNEYIFGKLYSDDEEEEEEQVNSVFNSSDLSYLSDCHENYVFHTEKNCKNRIQNKQEVLEDESECYSGIRIDRKKEVNNEHKLLTYQMNMNGKETKRKGE